MILTTMALSSNELDQKEQLNNYLIRFQLQKITYNGIEGYFIPFEGYRQLTFILNDYIFTQMEMQIYKDQISFMKIEIDKLQTKNKRLSYGFGITLALDIGFACIIAGVITGFSLYSYR